ncbi:unnamed protein product [Porites evermanni]|uniref:G-protein coupled receptors family 1 profile domain-containing protein n=1 Tax=Porites evermanni TaxID=104178 RepID=A0ABN8LBY9_9CNID|nr:unnamed protein product [Porites evermanni]
MQHSTGEGEIVYVNGIGNCFIGAIVFETKSMGRTVDYLIDVNMAMSDLLFPIFTIPRILTDLYAVYWLIDGPSGLALCKLCYFLQESFLSCSLQEFSFKSCTVLVCSFTPYQQVIHNDCTGYPADRFSTAYQKTSEPEVIPKGIRKNPTLQTGCSNVRVKPHLVSHRDFTKVNVQ